MLNSFKALQSNHLEKCENQFVFPIMRWMSGAPENLNVCEQANINFFKLKPKIIYSILSICPKKGFLKYPKKAKAEEDDKEEIIRAALQKHFQWSELEYSKNKIAIPDTQEFLQELNKLVGFDQKECKKLGLEFKKAEKYEFIDKPKSKGLSCFM